MANPEWGTKRQCPKCGTRFYDLGNDDPITCIECEKTFKPEIILKSKMTPLEMVSEDPVDDAEDDLELPDETEVDDVEIDADDNTVVLSDDDGTNVADVVAKPVATGSDE